MKKTKTHSHNHEELSFSGERMVPKLNKGMTLYYEHLTRYLMATGLVKNKNVLDVGCGTGYGSWLLKEMGARSVSGFDISEESINYAKKNYKTTGVNFRVGNAEKFPKYKNKFDLIVTFELIEHIDDHDAFLKQVTANLQKNGTLIVSTPNKNTYQNENLYHINELTPDEFEKLLNGTFKYVELFDQRFLFSNFILPVHNKTDKEFSKIDESYIQENVNCFLPLNKLDDCRYLVAICSNSKVKSENFSISTLSVDNFSLKEGVEGLYADWSKATEENKQIKDQYQEFKDSKFYKLYQGYNLFKKLLSGNQ